MGGEGVPDRFDVLGVGVVGVEDAGARLGVVLIVEEALEVLAP